MAQGIPTIAARSSSLPEVGEDAALYFDPRDAHALAMTIRRLADSDALKRELAARGHAQAAKFRWSDAARKTGDVFVHVVERSR